MSEKFIVSARKYRPATFRTVVGQQHITSTLKNAITTGRLAQAYLFCGPRGVGKTSCARIFAKTINCMNPTSDGEACGECDSCLSIDRGNSFNIIELDAASNNSVDDIRSITEQVNVPPQLGKYRVFIIDEVHMLSSQAFNAFLKTLEEPPAYAIFVMATTEKHKVIPTILSRCQIYDFKRITPEDIVDHLAYVAEQEGINADRRALSVISRKADGAMRDALSIFDQTAASTGGNLTYEAVVESLNVLDYDYFFRLVDDFSTCNVPDALLLYKEVRDHGFDSLFFVNSLAQHVRDLMVAANPATLPLLEVPDDVKQRLGEQAKSLPLQWYYTAMAILNDCDLNYRTSSNKQLLVELSLIKLCQLNNKEKNPFEYPDSTVQLRPFSAPSGTMPEKESQPASTPAQQAVAAQPAAPSAPMRPAAMRQPLAPQPTPRHTAGVARMSIRINNRPATHVAESRERNAAFTDEQLQECWMRYAEQNPQEQLLVSAMRICRPQREKDNSFLIYVQHPSQLQAFELSMKKLVDFLRDGLNNDLITLHAELDPNVEQIRMLPPKEFLKKTMEENPMLGDFLRSVDAVMD